jgi:hydroxymethylpyrimidine pyrophosphatase-like HAD family hydrolase
MHSVFKLFLMCSLIFVINNSAYAQNKKLSVDDQLIQDSIYKSNQKKVLNFSMKEFDTLFFEYFSKKNNPDITLTKTEFYNYTVQIATFSDRLAKLYPEQKQVAEQNKEKWFSESYEEYLDYKAGQKK